MWPALHRVHQSVLARAEPPQQRIPVLGNRGQSPSGEMLTISGANWFSRRGGTCRLHAIYEPSVYVGKVGKTVKYGWEPIPAEAQNLKMAQVDVQAGL